VLVHGNGSWFLVHAGFCRSRLRVRCFITAESDSPPVINPHFSKKGFGEPRIPGKKPRLHVESLRAIPSTTIAATSRSEEVEVYFYYFSMVDPKLRNRLKDTAMRRTQELPSAVVTRGELPSPSQGKRKGGKGRTQ
jgi:hypothetical protein